MARIMVVDDAAIMRRNLKIILSQAGHTVVAEAADGMHAFIEYEKSLPDLVTMDITMPRMNGIEAVKRIIEKFPDAKIVMISALDQRNMVFEALKSGAKHYILKPITEDKVISVVTEVLRDLDKNESQATADTLVKAENIAVKPAQDNVIPFAIENKNGTFLINIEKTMGSQNFSALNAAIQGLMFVKPLKAIFNFGDAENLNGDVMDNILANAMSMQSSGGLVKIVGRNESLIAMIKAKNRSLTADTYTNLDEIVI